jgi:hypothetical protein
MNQCTLIKLNSSETLQGKEASVAKSEYQANYDELRQLKKDLFRVSLISTCGGKTNARNLDQSSCSLSQYIVDADRWVLPEDGVP